MFSFYTRTDNRISRKALWLAVVLPFTALTYGAIYAESVLLRQDTALVFAGTSYGYISLALTLILAWPWFATSVRRFHDINMSGWWNVFYLPMYLWVPDFLHLDGYPLAITAAWGISVAISFVLSLMQLFRPGTFGANRFGIDPLDID